MVNFVRQSVNKSNCTVTVVYALRIQLVCTLSELHPLNLCACLCLRCGIMIASYICVNYMCMTLLQYWIVQHRLTLLRSTFVYVNGCRSFICDVAVVWYLVWFIVARLKLLTLTSLLIQHNDRTHSHLRALNEWKLRVEGGRIWVYIKYRQTRF